MISGTALAFYMHGALGLPFMVMNWTLASRYRGDYLMSVPYLVKHLHIALEVHDFVHVQTCLRRG